MRNKNIFLKDNMRMLFLVISIICFGSVALALIAQYEFDMQPCPWCILQRLIFIIIGIMGLIFSFFPTLQLKMFGLASISATCIVGAIVAFYQFFIASNSNECNISLAERIISILGLSERFPNVFGIFAFCNVTNPMVFGIPFVLLSLVMFLILNHMVLTSLVNLKRINQLN